MGGKIDSYNWGSSGVDLTKSIIHADDGTFRQAQNGVPDPRGEFGGVAKRDGLVAINSSTAGGAVQGAINVALPSTRNFYLGRSAAATWVTSTDEFASASATSSIGAAVNPTFLNNSGFGPYTDGLQLMPRAAFNGRFLVYPGTYTRWDPGVAANDAPNLRLWNGSTDREICRVPFNAGLPDAGQGVAAGEQINALGIGDMLLDGNVVYFCVFDYFNNSFFGRVFMLDLTTLALTQLGQAFGNNATTELAYGMPLSLCVSSGYLWVGTGFGMSSSPGGAGSLVRIRPGVDTTWTLEETFNTSESVVSIASYRGLMYVGTSNAATSPSVKARLMVMAADRTWSALTDSEGTPDQSGSRISALVVFNDALYFASTNKQTASSTAKIRKYDGSSVSTVHTYSLETGNEPQLGLNSIVHNGKIYFIVNVDDGSTYAFGRITKSSDGTTWAELTGSPVTTITGRFGIVVT